jgi:tetratricopeptide (TPR) repeat protein
VEKNTEPDLLPQTGITLPAGDNDVEALRKLWKDNPEDGVIAARLAQLYTDLGWFHEAKDLYKDILTRQPNDFTLLLAFGNLCFNRQMHADALDTFRKLTVLKPDRLEGWNNLGIVQLSTGDDEGARKSFEKVLSLEPENCGALVNMGNYYDRSGDVEKAATYFNRAVKIRPDFSDAWYNLGNAYLTGNEFEKAITAYQKAIRFQREFPSAFKNLGFAYEQTGNLDKALEFYNQALAINKADSALYSNIAHVYTRRQEYDKAKDFYLKAVRIAPKDPTGWMGLRQLSYLKGDIQTYVRATLAIFPRLESNVIADSIRKLRELRFFEGVDSLIKMSDRNHTQGEELDAERLLAYVRTNQLSSKIDTLFKKLSQEQRPSDHILYCLAEYQATCKDFDSALAYIKEIKTLELAGYVLLWRCLRHTGSAALAESRIDEYLVSHEDCFEAHFQKALLAADADNEEKVTASLLNALDNGFTETERITENSVLKKCYEAIIQNIKA